QCPGRPARTARAGHTTVQGLRGPALAAAPEPTEPTTVVHIGNTKAEKPAPAPAPTVTPAPPVAAAPVKPAAEPNDVPTAVVQAAYKTEKVTKPEKAIPKTCEVRPVVNRHCQFVNSP